MKKWFVLYFFSAFVALAPSWAQEPCEGVLSSRLVNGGQGRVTPGDANNVRDIPSRAGAKVGEIAGGTRFDVLEGPACQDGFAWYRVLARDSDGDIIHGWTVEAIGDTYALEPLDTAPFSFAGANIVFSAAFLYEDPPYGEFKNLLNDLPYLLLANSPNQNINVHLFDAESFSRHYPALVPLLRARLNGEPSEAFDEPWVAGAFNPFGGAIAAERIAYAEVVPMEDGGKAWRFLVVQPRDVVYYAYGLTADGAHYVLVTAAIGEGGDLTELADAQAEDGAPIGQRSPILSALDALLASLTIDATASDERLIDADILARPACGAFVSRMKTGRPALQILQNDPIRVRDAPNGALTGLEIPPRARVWLLSEPVCANNRTWWRISLDRAPLTAVGWVAEYGESNLFFEMTDIAPPYPVIVLADGTIASPTPDPDQFCKLLIGSGTAARSLPTLRLNTYVALDEGRYTPFGYFIDEAGVLWYRLGETNDPNIGALSAATAIRGYWVRADDISTTGDCYGLIPLFLEQVTLDEIECFITFAVQTNLRPRPDGSIEATSFANPGRFRAAEQYARAGEGFRWWRISREHHSSLEGGLWVREDFVTEEGDCQALPTYEPRQ